MLSTLGAVVEPVVSSSTKRVCYTLICGRVAGSRVVCPCSDSKRILHTSCAVGYCSDSVTVAVEDGEGRGASG